MKTIWTVNNLKNILMSGNLQKEYFGKNCDVSNEFRHLLQKISIFSCIRNVKVIHIILLCVCILSTRSAFIFLFEYYMFKHNISNYLLEYVWISRNC